MSATADVARYVLHGCALSQCKNHSLDKNSGLFSIKETTFCKAIFSVPAQYLPFTVCQCWRVMFFKSKTVSELFLIKVLCKNFFQGDKPFVLSETQTLIWCSHNVWSQIYYMCFWMIRIKVSLKTSHTVLADFHMHVCFQSYLRSHETQHSCNWHRPKFTKCSTLSKGTLCQHTIPTMLTICPASAMH